MGGRGHWKKRGTLIGQRGKGRGGEVWVQSLKPKNKTKTSTKEEGSVWHIQFEKNS